MRAAIAWNAMPAGSGTCVTATALMPSSSTQPWRRSVMPRLRQRRGQLEAVAADGAAAVVAEVGRGAIGVAREFLAMIVARALPRAVVHAQTMDHHQQARTRCDEGGRNRLCIRFQHPPVDAPLQ